MMARKEAAMQLARGAVPQGAPAQDREWRQLSPQQDFTRWADEFGSILHLLKSPDQAR
jgi:hypothetical protein